MDNRYLFPLLLVALALIKPIATAATTGSGGVGGTFAPTLFVGCAIGYAFALLCNFFGVLHLPPMNFALAGMAGALSGIMAAPLTGIFLIAELTGGYELFIPLIIVASLSTVIARQFEPWSIYTQKLGNKGRLITHHRDKAAITLLRIQDLLETDLPTIDINATVSSLAAIIAENARPFYQVKNGTGSFAGIIETRELIPILADGELQKGLILADLVREPRVHLDISMNSAAFFTAFDKSGEEELPVFNGESFLGFLTKERLYEAYRAKMEEISEENEA
jgi:CIC family chloride channel protein